MKELIERLRVHQEIPEVASAIEALEDGEFEYALRMMDQVLGRFLVLEDAELLRRTA